MTFIVAGGIFVVIDVTVIFSELTLKIGLAFGLASFFVQVVVQVKYLCLHLLVIVCANDCASGV